jgi:hypothetical protein
VISPTRGPYNAFTRVLGTVPFTILIAADEV